MVHLLQAHGCAHQGAHQRQLDGAPRANYSSGGGFDDRRAHAAVSLHTQSPFGRVALGRNFSSAIDHSGAMQTADVEQHLHTADVEQHLPEGLIRQPDLFGEAITFVRDVDINTLRSIDGPSRQTSNTNNNDGPPMERPKPLSPGSVAADLSSFDGMSLCIISKGAATAHVGNDGDGPDAKAFHAAALAWSELLRCAWEWNGKGVERECISSAPMLAVAAAAPVVAQGGVHYLHRIDRLLGATGDGDASSPPPSLWTMAQNAVALRDATMQDAQLDEDSEPAHLVTPRERWHLHALDCLLHNDHRGAMGAYLRLLELFPGDLLGLSLALDVAYTMGDATGALRAATNVSTYWDERGGGALQPRTFSNSMASSLIAVGLAASSISSRASTAERLAETAISRDMDGAGGTAVWALSHCLASEGRSSEMVSKLAGFDGTQHYEGCGYLHFLTRMKGYGGIALLDRRGAGADRSAVRLYDGGFGNVLDYSGTDVRGMERGGEEVCLREAMVPRSIKKDMAGAVGSMFTGWLGGGGNSGGNNGTDERPNKESEGVNPGTVDPSSVPTRRRTMEDVLCWLPPSPLLLAHATSMLLRLTLCDGIRPSDHRWDDLRAAWVSALKYDHGNDASPRSETPIAYMPLALLASSLVVDLSELRMNGLSPPLHCAMQGLYKMGALMKLGQLNATTMATAEHSDASRENEWREVVRLLSQARDSCQRWEMPSGMESSTYGLPRDGLASSVPSCTPIGWDFHLRQFLEHSLCYAAMEVGDYESLCLARAICSEGITLRSNCPELWWRYGAILDMLGDEVAAENARAASVSLGSGEGGNTF